MERSWISRNKEAQLSCSKTDRSGVKRRITAKLLVFDFLDMIPNESDFANRTKWFLVQFPISSLVLYRNIETQNYENLRTILWHTVPISLHGRAARTIFAVDACFTNLSTVHDKYLCKIYIKNRCFVDLFKSYLSFQISGDGWAKDVWDLQVPTWILVCSAQPQLWKYTVKNENSKLLENPTITVATIFM